MISLGKTHPIKLEFFKKKLEREKQKIIKELSRYAKIKQVGGKTEFIPRHIEVGSSKDEDAQEFGLYEQNVTIEETLKTRLEKIESALKKISKGPKGGYGICEHCGKVIDLKRLKTFPEVRHCSSCHQEGLVD